jgi:hypothetical protein
MLALATVSGLFEPQTSVEDIERVLTPAVRIGWDPGKVIGFLDTRQVEHSSFGPASESELESLRREGFQLTPTPAGIIYALYRRTSWNLFAVRSIQVIFAFDKRRKLTAYEIREITRSLW